MLCRLYIVMSWPIGIQCTQLNVGSQCTQYNVATYTDITVYRPHLMMYGLLRLAW
jgi:hypothetical protein